MTLYRLTDREIWEQRRDRLVECPHDTMEALDTLVSRPGECPLCHRFDRTDFHMMCGPNEGQHVAISDGAG